VLCDPSAAFAFAPGHADAALLATQNAITAAILKVRLDTGSPPFFADRHMPCRENSRGTRAVRSEGLLVAVHDTRGKAARAGAPRAPRNHRRTKQERKTRLAVYGAVITYESTSLGVNDTGELNFNGLGPGGVLTHGVFRAGVGDAISPGCFCEAGASL
jgi:hypothetical protein